MDKKYIEEKIDMLINEFYMKLTDDEIDHFYSLKTESAVDRYAHKLLMDKL